MEDLPPNAKKPKGQAFQIPCFVGADHGGDQVTQRSRTGILIFLNKDPIIWYSKPKIMVDKSGCGNLKGTEIKGIKYL